MRIIALTLALLITSCSNSEFNGQTPQRFSKSKKLTPSQEAAKSQSGQQPAAEALSAPKLFNVAILTHSVKCLFCHMKIEGDVGGIDFPSNDLMHERAGEGLRILGTLFATNDIPEKLASAPQAQKVSPNYKNTELKIFPTTKDASGNTVFPTVTADMLRNKTRGTVKADSRSIMDSYSGAVTLLSGSEPIEIDGEIFIDGDLIIGGNYKGVGTIYARNIFIVRDLKAVNSAFPFPSDPAAAKQAAEASITAKTDGLYLMALGQITVGYPDSRFLSETEKVKWMTYTPSDPALTRSSPSDLAAYKALAQKTTCQIRSSNNNHSTEYYAVLVNRVDAFLYVGNYLLWRTCDGITLNGGFVAPNVAVVNANDANDNLDDDPVNVIRYDYRLRAGIKAYSLLREFFEQ